MSTIETILTRAMIDPDFAEQLFNDTHRALAPYNLSAPEIAQIIAMPRAAFISHAVEARKSFAFMGGNSPDEPGGSGGPNHNQTILKVK